MDNILNNKLPNILLVGPALGGGGAEGRFKNLCTHLFNGYNDTAIFSIKSNADKPNQRQFINLKWAGPLSAFNVVSALRQLIIRNNYDVIMSFGFYPNIITWMALIGIKNKPKLIFNEITRPWLESKNSNLVRKFIYRFFRKLAYPQCDKLLVNSIDGMDECIRYFGVKQTKIQRVSNLINTQRIQNLINMGSPIIPEFERYFIVLARLDSIKRIDLILRSFADLPSAIECGIVVVGDGAELQTLQKLVVELGIEKRTLFTGMLENPFPILANAYALILASKYEGFSNAVLEAMFCNVPVITHYCSADAVDMCQQNAALGFDIENLGNLSQCMENILLSDSLRNELIRNAVFYSEKHSIDKGIVNYEKAIMDTFF